MSGSKKIFSAVVCFLFLVVASLFSGVTAAQAVVVIDGPFGDVPLGSTGTSAIQVNAPALSGLKLTGWGLTGGGGPFSINTTVPSTGIILGPGESVAIEVSFVPLVAGPASDTLVIATQVVNDWSVVTGEIHLNLTGTGNDNQAARADTVGASQGQDLIAFFDNAVATGAMESKGKGKSARKRLKAVRKRIKSVEKKLNKGKQKKACRQIRAISGKLGSHTQGEAVGELADRLSTLANDLGCN
jgi:hypothetical protein